MRIKKKNLILESLLIDKIDEFTPYEKKLLGVLHKKFGFGSGKLDNSWYFDKWKSAAYLIEFFEVPYDVAHSLASTYYWNGDKLFMEYEPIRKHENRSYLMMNYAFNDILKDYVESRQDVDGKFLISPIEYFVKTQNENETIPGIIAQIIEPRTYSEVNNITIELQPTVWTRYNGITLYIQPNKENIKEPKNIVKTTWDTLKNMGVMVHLELKPFDDEDSKSKNFVKSEAIVTFGDEYKYEEILFKEDIKIPIPLSKDNIIKFIEMLIEKIRSAINGMTFIYGKGEKRD